MKSRILSCSSDVYDTQVRYKIFFTSLNRCCNFTIIHIVTFQKYVIYNMEIPIFLKKELYYVKKLYNSICKNIDDHMTLKY